MMTVVVTTVAVVLAAIAAAGVLRPFGRREVPGEAPLDPLEDERRSLLRSIRELDEERQAGELSEGDYRSLRRETEARAVAVLRALEAREGAGEMASRLREFRISVSGNGSGGDGEAVGPERPGIGRRVVAGLLLAALAAALVVPALTAALRSRTSDQPLTGDPAGVSALAFFEDRVARHPNDLAARLDLAQRYLETGDAGRAAEQYRVALSIDPGNPEALTRIGLILYGNGLPSEALDSVDLAIGSDPGYAEAYYVRGVVLLEGLNRPRDAVDALQRYLDLAPFGSYRADALKLLDRARSSG